MDAERVKQIEAAALNEGIEVQAREGYSGRGMYGSTTGGLVGSMSDIVAAITIYGRNCDDDEHYELVQECLGLSTDSMGRDIIVY